MIETLGELFISKYCRNTFNCSSLMRVRAPAAAANAGLLNAAAAAIIGSAIITGINCGGIPMAAAAANGTFIPGGIGIPAAIPANPIPINN
ncbi:hypothetical protein DERP_008948 [Dermatophagoides pteronyssinus]|uniref:Uncharacterized protein n=1 Tax=Dermatophagoides pteronyssinus TaxID=6956 RepID=A0ABQ8JNB5_DERPT|nr:hypothetical protein DERP_008948 [Dermatophagoides pteronyssinus]